MEPRTDDETPGSPEPAERRRLDAPTLAVRGRVTALTPADASRLFDRGQAAGPEVERVVASIVADVRGRGDAALLELARRLDGVELDAIEVPPAATAAALESLSDPVRAALEQALHNIASFHRAQLPEPIEVEVRPGVRLGRRAEPLRRIGVYAPGGRAAYPSSVLMGVVPARVAGVEEVVVCSPPGPDGRPSATVLAACALAGADRVFALGGAGAIAALACGTESVPRVDKVVGPGNAYVTEAKRQLTGMVAIDCPAGPSEVLVIADETADPERIALELIAQAEHDPDAAVALVATTDALADATESALARLVARQPRREIIEAALAARGAILVADSLGRALRFAERYAPEHLLLLVERPRAALERVRAAGTTFLGAGGSVAFGDYLTGANHVLPTAGLARAYSGLSTLDFVRFSTYQEITPAAAAELAGPTATLADAEGLPGHAAAARAHRAAGGEGATTEAATARPPSVTASAGAAVAGAIGSVARSDARSDAGPDAGSDTVPGAGPRRETTVAFRPAYRGLELYDPGRRPVAVDLSDNTNRFGPPPAAARALAELGTDALTRYPSVFADGLKRLLAELHGVAPENVATGCGSDDVIDSAVRAFCEPGDVLAYPEPTFGMVPLFARMNAARPVGVPLDRDFALDPDALAAARGRITYVCRPNNPTGTLFERHAVERLATRAGGVVLLDEAYADFAGDSMVEWAVDTGRVLVLRTLSKSWGLAGLRIGYAIGAAPLVREIEKSRGPYKITAAADAAAHAALTEDREWHRRTTAEGAAARERLAAELARVGLRTWPSAANFVLARVPAGHTARSLAGALRERGVAVRAFPDLPGVGDGIRVSAAPWPLLERFLVALQDIVGRDAGANPSNGTAQP